MNNADVFKHLNTSWELSDNYPDSNKKELITNHGRVVDSYSLLENNCTTKIVDALKNAGSRVFSQKVFSIDIDEEFIIPLSLGKHLEEESETFNMIVVNVTDEMKMYISNLDKLKEKEKTKRNSVEEGVVSSANTSGSFSGYTVGD